VGQKKRKEEGVGINGILLSAVPPNPSSSALRLCIPYPRICADSVCANCSALPKTNAKTCWVGGGEAAGLNGVRDDNVVLGSSCWVMLTVVDMFFCFCFFLMNEWRGR
jgi:hypothetical protein